MIIERTSLNKLSQILQHRDTSYNNDNSMPLDAFIILINYHEPHVADQIGVTLAKMNVS